MHRNDKYNTRNVGSYIFEFKHQEKKFAIDATKENNTYGRLINHSKRKPNVKPFISTTIGRPNIFFKSITYIKKDEELLYDYGDNCKESVKHFPWLNM